MLTNLEDKESHDGFLSAVEKFRLQAISYLKPKNRAKLGQYFTPLSIANFMASMVPPHPSHTLKILDPGAGTGVLSATLVHKLLNDENPPHHISFTAFEIDKTLHPYLKSTYQLCQKECLKAGVSLKYSIFAKEFINVGTRSLITERQKSLFGPELSLPKFDLVIANPPYRKISSQSTIRKNLRNVGIETSNLYSAFIAVALMLMASQGDLVAITPRSFCNGVYFKPFREFLFDKASFRRIHIFEARDEIFSDAAVLQENIIFHLNKDNSHLNRVWITSNNSPSDPAMSRIELAHQEVIDETDPNKFIHIITDQLRQKVVRQIKEFPCCLGDLGVQISTGRVVDFRARQFIQKKPTTDTVPLIYPLNIRKGGVVWPRNKTKKPQAIVRCVETENLLIDNGIYLLIKRFTSKEQPKRIVAALYQPDDTKNSEKIGFENHLNYVHRNGKPLEKDLALGLYAFLTSTWIDIYFRVFNGHTQVNATDLRAIKYPTVQQLEDVGRRLGSDVSNQDKIDKLVERYLLIMADEVSPVSAAKKNRASKFDPKTTRFAQSSTE